MKISQADWDRVMAADRIVSIKMRHYTTPQIVRYIYKPTLINGEWKHVRTPIMDKPKDPCGLYEAIGKMSGLDYKLSGSMLELTKQGYDHLRIYVQLGGHKRPDDEMSVSFWHFWAGEGETGMGEQTMSIALGNPESIRKVVDAIKKIVDEDRPFKIEEKK